LIKVVGSAILDEIIRRVKGAEMYAIIADETPDLSKTEQLAVLVRYVWNGVIEERLLAVEPMEETTAEALFHTIREKLQQCGIEFSNMRGQCYDGASNVSGIHTGLQARIKEISPSAIYTHCYAHVLNLVIVDTMSNNSIARDFFGTLQNLYVFIETCTKRHAVYLKHQRKLNASDDEGKKKREYVLKKLSDTRWACRADSITAIYHTLEAVIATLKEIRENEKKAHIAAEAKGLFQNICHFEFVLALEVLF
jgi:transcriptional antiterminator Rof (Rho-off)